MQLNCMRGTESATLVDMLDWLIVGGGIHGTLLSRALTGTGRVPSDRIRVLDPHADALARWDLCAGGCGMTVMRSPSVHNLDLEPFSLRRFSQATDRLRAFIEPYHRPHLALFRAHCDWMLDRYGLRELRVRGSATDLRAGAGCVVVDTDAGTLRARRVVLAIGGSGRLRWPLWADELRGAGGCVHHVFEAALPETHDLDGATAIIGGGITAAQTAIALHERGAKEVVIVARHLPRISAFDIDPGWLGPRYLVGFHRERDLAARRRIITHARRRGSVPKEVLQRLRRLVRDGDVRQVTDEIAFAATQPQGVIALHGRAGVVVDVRRVILATGFDDARPGGDWLTAAIAKLELPTAPCGFPAVGSGLRWHPRIHVTGALAELEVGPAARNIAGARMAAARIVATA
jgi:cation diffusion facilitator CzcD-associated flavoprotein CzcO